MKGENGKARRQDIITAGLRDSERFVDITDGNRRYYGGNQAWFEWGGDRKKEIVARKAGCGVVAAANIAAYLAGSNPDYRGLYPYPGYTKEDYILHMKEMYEYIPPFHLGEIPLGVWPVERLARGMKRFSASRGVRIRPVWCRRIFNRRNMIRYIADGLNGDCPVAMLVGMGRLKKSAVTYYDGRVVMENMKLHWVTVTELKVNEAEKTATVKVSTWGGWAELDLDAYLDEWIYEGILYFG